MINNPVLKTLMRRKSIRKYKEDIPADEVLLTIVKAGQQAPFAYQIYSILLSRKKEKNIFKAPFLFTICLDMYKFECIMKKRNWVTKTSDLGILILGLQDATYCAENMVIAAESLGLGSCFIGSTPFIAAKIKKEYSLPERVFPLVQLAMGYPAEDPPVRPRYPKEFTLFEDKYPKLDDKKIKKAMQKMDEGYLAQDYYIKANYMIELTEKTEEKYSFDNYSWTEHISRKLGQWNQSPEDLLKQLKICGFDLTKSQEY